MRIKLNNAQRLLGSLYTSLKIYTVGVFNILCMNHARVRIYAQIIIIYAHAYIPQQSNKKH